MEQCDVMVGVDVSGARLDVGIWPGGESFSVGNDTRGVEELVTRMIELRPLVVVLEATGGLEGLLASELYAADLAVAVVNPRQVRSLRAVSGNWPRPTGSTRKFWRNVGIRCIAADACS